MLSAFRTVVIVDIERAGGASFAFGRISVLGGDEFLARGALGYWYTHDALRCVCVRVFVCVMRGGAGGKVKLEFV